MVRALEVHTLTGKPISDWQQTWDTKSFADDPATVPPPVRIPSAVLELPREELYERINRRVDAMLAAGWFDEVRRLRELPRPLSREAQHALGYRELLAYLHNTGPAWDETVELIRTHTRQFAKRQLTWFRHLPQLVPVSVDAPNAVNCVVRAWAEDSA